MITESMKNNDTSKQDSKSSRISFFAMMADPIRHKIVTELQSKSELSVNQLVDSIKKPQTLISYHLRCLRECGLLTSEKSVDDGRKILYSLHDPGFITQLFDLADNFLKNHKVCLGHPSCQIKQKRL
jgi:DNA-binding transcriptional ArsR family regulator